MADLASVKVLALQLLDEVCLAQGVETVSAQIVRLTQERDDAVNALAPYKAFRDTAVADAQARKANDAAKVDGDDILTAAAGLP